MTKNGLNQLIFEEGLRLKRYKCSMGFWTIGYGHNLDSKPLHNGKRIPSVITRQFAEDLLHADVAETTLALEQQWPAFKRLDPAHKDAAINMAFQLGIRGFLNFRKMRLAVESKNWYQAYIEAFDSNWARQTPGRAQRLAYQWATGSYYPVPEVLT